MWVKWNLEDFHYHIEVFIYQDRLERLPQYVDKLSTIVDGTSETIRGRGFLKRWMLQRLRWIVLWMQLLCHQNLKALMKRKTILIRKYDWSSVCNVWNWKRATKILEFGHALLETGCMTMRFVKGFYMDEDVPEDLWWWWYMGHCGLSIHKWSTLEKWINIRRKIKWLVLLQVEEQERKN